MRFVQKRIFNFQKAQISIHRGQLNKLFSEPTYIYITLSYDTEYCAIFSANVELGDDAIVALEDDPHDMNAKLQMMTDRQSSHSLFCHLI